MLFSSPKDLWALLIYQLSLLVSPTARRDAGRPPRRLRRGVIVAAAVTLGVVMARRRSHPALS